MGQAEPTRHVSGARLRQPTPDLHGFAENVRKLERSAEELSAGGSDIGDEIRKMNELSRPSSLQSSSHGDISVIRPSVMERMSSLQSARRNSTRRSIDTNSVTSPGPYSPNRLVWSPTTMSAPWSPLPPTQTSRPSQLQPIQASYAASEGSTRSRDASNSSFVRRYDEIAGEIQESLQHIPPSQPGHGSKSDLRESLYAPSERRRSIATFQEAQLAFTDFDGVHYSPDSNEYVETDHNGNEIRRISIRSSSGRHSLAAPSLLHTSRGPPHPQVVPPPAEGMAYYPAPVPRTLNLPKRLSQLPAATVQSKRKTQLLNQLSEEAGAAAPWLSPGKHIVAGTDTPQHSRPIPTPSGALFDGPQNNRMSSSTLNVPAHARAELFFKHRQVSQDVELKPGSAVATLDSILEASATAPVSAFTDHPFAGDVRKSVYAVEHKPQKSADLETADNVKTKRRSGSIPGVLRRAVSSDNFSTIMKDGNTIPKSAKKLQKRRSLGDDLNRQHTEPQSDPSTPEEVTAEHADRSVDEQDIEEDSEEAETQEDVDGNPVYVKPSTLLAELQVRKAQQKSRSRTAVTAFPNGMHSTLLELDAVQQIAQQRRKGQKVALAWEDPSQRLVQESAEAGDEDVPLGMLFNGTDGLISRRVGDGKDWDRPLGLMERRNLEDEEPLSSRRNRLKGIPPITTAPPLVTPELLINGRGHGEDDQDDEHETLAQRARRMKAETTSINIGDSSASQEQPISDGFADDVLSKFGAVTNDNGDGSKSAPTAKSAPSPDLEEETLGQRRARLQREREAQGLNSTARASASNLPSQPFPDPIISFQPPAAYGQMRAPSGGYAASTYSNNMGGMQFPTNSMLPTHGANMVPYGYGGSMAAFAAAQAQLQQQWMQSSGMMFQPTVGSTFMGNGYHANDAYAAQAQRNEGLGNAMNDARMPAPRGPNTDRWRLGV